jgi:Holliday junction resolvase RusA-like endonuclease
LSERDVENLVKQVIDRLNVNQLFTQESIENCLIGQTLEVGIKDNKAWIA